MWKKIAGMVLAAGFLICALAGWFAPERVIQTSEEQFGQVKKEVEKENYEKAFELLDEIDKKQGVTDRTLYIRAEIAVLMEDYKQALQWMENVKNPHTERYFEGMEQIYRLENTKKSMKNLDELYVTAAGELPENGRMQYLAGLVKLKEGAVKSAVYYLSNARNLDEKDAMSSYYLGVICYEQNDWGNAALYFDEAVERGIGEEKLPDIKWYLLQMAGEGEYGE
ncbi:MAG: hypothetical protein KH828_12485 [Clostridiales bacterium]|nr:hypothetical protein [Clostridiales bacterium]